MGKPYMPLMMGDWIRGTRAMRANVKGVYIGLLIHQYDHGYVPEDLETLSLIEPEVGSVWVMLSDKFPVSEPGKRKNPKLEEVRAFWSKQAKNGEKGGRPKKENPNHNPDNNPKDNPNHNHHIDIDNNVLYRLSSEVFSFLKRKGSNTSEITDMVRFWIKEGATEILPQLNAMRGYYDLHGLTFPTRVVTLTQSFLEADWIAKLKETDPERKAERKANGNITATELPALAPANKPGALDL